MSKRSIELTGLNQDEPPLKRQRTRVDTNEKSSCLQPQQKNNKQQICTQSESFWDTTEEDFDIESAMHNTIYNLGHKCSSCVWRVDETKLPLEDAMDIYNPWPVKNDTDNTNKTDNNNNTDTTIIVNVNGTRGCVAAKDLQLIPYFKICFNCDDIENNDNVLKLDENLSNINWTIKELKCLIKIIELNGKIPHEFKFETFKSLNLLLDCEKDLYCNFVQGGASMINNIGVLLEYFDGHFRHNKLFDNLDDFSFDKNTIETKYPNVKFAFSIASTLHYYENIFYQQRMALRNYLFMQREIGRIIEPTLNDIKKYKKWFESSIGMNGYVILSCVTNLILQL